MKKTCGRGTDGEYRETKGGIIEREQIVFKTVLTRKLCGEVERIWEKGDRVKSEDEKEGRFKNCGDVSIWLKTGQPPCDKDTAQMSSEEEEDGIESSYCVVVS